MTVIFTPGNDVNKGVLDTLPAQENRSLIPGSTTRTDLGIFQFRCFLLVDIIVLICIRFLDGIFLKDTLPALAISDWQPRVDLRKQLNC